MRLSLLAIAVLPLVSTYELHTPSPLDEVVVTPSTTNEYTPDAGRSIYAAPPLMKPGQCTKPVVRREWRTLSKWDKKAWIDALKVSSIVYAFIKYLTSILLVRREDASHKRTIQDPYCRRRSSYQRDCNALRRLDLPSRGMYTD